ncbi:hypothetical protein SprV_0100014700 [Sparganum proliferum]
MSRPRRLDVAKIWQASTAEALSREIRSCFTTRANRKGSNQWSSLKMSVYGAAKILGYTQRRRSDWVSGRVLQLRAQTARARSRNDDSFRQLRKMTTKSARDGRKQYWAEIATSMEQASNVGDTRKLYQRIRQVSGKLSTRTDSVRDVNGGFIADNSAKVERWREHFEHHLNFDTQPTSPLLSSATYAVQMGRVRMTLSHELMLLDGFSQALENAYGFDANSPSPLRFACTLHLSFCMAVNAGLCA